MVACIAAPGDLDPGFDPGSGIDGQVNAIAVLPDGKLLIGGTFDTVRGLVRAGVARINSDGTGDSTFVPPIGLLQVNTLALQSDGKVLIGGVNVLERLNTDGSQDTTFNPGPISAGNISTIAVQSDGKMIVGGQATLNPSFNGLARLNANGSQDSGFNPSLTGQVFCAAVQADGKLFIGGDFLKAGDANNSGLARLNADGTLDNGFTVTLGATHTVYCVALQPDGKILIGGDFSVVNGTNRFRIARFNQDGSLDLTFDPGSGLTQPVRSIVLQPDGKVVVAGSSLIRLNSNGSPDGTFNPGSGPSSSVFSVVLQGDGKVVIGGDFSFVNGTSRIALARLDAEGTLDPSFISLSGIGEFTGAYSNNRLIRCIVAVPDGKAIIGGAFSGVGGTHRDSFARLNQDGTLDGSFNPQLTAGGFVVDIGSAVVQPDQKVLIGGMFTSVDGLSRNGIARVNPDGSLDSSFNPGSGLNSGGYVASVVLQPDGKVLIGGTFSVVNGVGLANIARLNADGSLDNGFDPGSGVSGFGGLGPHINCLALQSDGKVLIGGGFTSVNGVVRTNLARLNGNGTLDTNFNAGLVSGGFDVYSLAVQPDGRILVGGIFTVGNGPTRTNLARLNSDGTLDTTFEADLSIDGDSPGWVNALALQTNGQVLIGGVFDIVDTQSRGEIARLNPDGSVDLSFNPGTGVSVDNGSVISVALAADGNVLIGGVFASVNGAARWNSARLFGGTTTTTTNLPPSVSCPAPCCYQCSGSPFRVLPIVSVSDPESDPLIIVWSLNGVVVQTNALPGCVGPGPCNPYPLVPFLGSLPPGTNLLSVTVSDSAGNTASCATPIQVVDTTPPVISAVTAKPNVLWPPNHKMVDVQVHGDATDNCGPATWRIIGVRSNESTSRNPGSASSPDWEITGHHSLKLRADRSGNGADRIYTIFVQATDTSGNHSAPAAVTVRVPHDMGDHH